MVLGVLVEDPGHHLRVRPDVGRRDVLPVADDVVDPVDEDARQLLELVLRELSGVDGDATLGAAEGHANDGRLPRHERRERRDLVGVHLGMEPEPPLKGPRESSCWTR